MSDTPHICAYCRHSQGDPSGGLLLECDVKGSATTRPCFKWEREPGSDDNLHPIVRRLEN